MAFDSTLGYVIGYGIGMLVFAYLAIKIGTATSHILSSKFNYFKEKKHGIGMYLFILIAVLSCAYGIYSAFYYALILHSNLASMSIAGIIVAIPTLAFLYYLFYWNKLSQKLFIFYP